MFSFLIAFVHFFRVLIRLFRDKEIRAGMILLGFVLLLGTVFYHNIEGWSVLDSLYFCVVTLATIGFGDLTPQTDLGKIFTIIFIFLGMGLLVGILNIVAKKSLPKHDT